MATGELAVAALQRLLCPGTLLFLIFLVLLHEVLRQQLLGSASERAELALVA